MGNPIGGLQAELIKPSLSELEGVTGCRLGSEAEELAAARALQERGFAKAVLVSLGARGALLVTEGDAIRFPGFAIVPRTTVGAGDSMVAGLALGLSQGVPL